MKKKQQKPVLINSYTRFFNYCVDEDKEVGVSLCNHLETEQLGIYINRSVEYSGLVLLSDHDKKKLSVGVLNSMLRTSTLRIENGYDYNRVEDAAIFRDFAQTFEAMLCGEETGWSVADAQIMSYDHICVQLMNQRQFYQNREILAKKHRAENNSGLLPDVATVDLSPQSCKDQSYSIYYQKQGKKKRRLISRIASTREGFKVVVFDKKERPRIEYYPRESMSTEELRYGTYGFMAIVKEYISL